jgi:hypothetical protein
LSFAERIAAVNETNAKEFLQNHELTNPSYHVLEIVTEFEEALDLAEAAAERAERAEAAERAERERERAERAEAAERAERAEVRAYELKKLELHTKNIAVPSQVDVSEAGSCTTSELAAKTQLSTWDLPSTTDTVVNLRYAVADEAAVQAQMAALLGPIGKECGLMMADTHVAGVPGLHKPDLVFSLLPFVLNVLTALAVGVVVELKARRALSDAALFGGFTQDHVGQLIDKLVRLRRVRKMAVLYGICSNGFHVQYFMMSGQQLFKSDVFTLADRGMLKSVLRAAHASLVSDFQFLDLIAEQLPPAEWQIKSLLGAGSHCRAWEVGKGDESITLVVAETEEGRAHLRHNYDVFAELHLKNAPAQLDVLYKPFWINSSQHTTVAAFQQCGVRWSQSMMHLLTRRDVDDIVAQLAFMHQCGFIHGDVATRNFVRFSVDGVPRSVLIDAGSATKSGDAWRGGTVFNASIAWLEGNLHHISNHQRSQVQPGTPKDDLWAFVFALCDMRTVDRLQWGDVLAYRRAFVQSPHVAEIGMHVEKLEYAVVTRKVSDLFFAGDLSPTGLLLERPVKT